MLLESLVLKGGWKEDDKGSKFFVSVFLLLLELRQEKLKHDREDTTEKKLF